MQTQSSPSLQEIVKSVTELLGNAYADRFQRQPSENVLENVYVGAINKVSELFADAAGPRDITRVTCCYPGNVTGTATSNQACYSAGGTPGACGGQFFLPPLNQCQQVIQQMSQDLGNAYAGKLDQAGSQAQNVYQDIVQKLAQLFKDANAGVGVPLVTCQLPDGTSLPNLTEKQCAEVGGNVVQ